MAGGENGRNGSGEHSGNTDGLIPWEPGESGNPAGRPRGAKDGLRATLRRRLKAEPDGMMADTLKALGIDLTDKKNADAVVEMLLFKVARGDIQALKLAFDQTEEPLKRAIEHTGENGGPIELQVSNAQERLMEDITRELEAASGNGKAEHP